MRDNWSTELFLFIVLMLFVLLIVVPWMTRHPHVHTHGGTTPQSPSEAHSDKP
jgi:hypothetical protein